MSAVRAVGLDVVDLGRLAGVLERHGAAFERRVFVAGEIRPGLRGPARVAHLGGLFAAKEAVLKALGTGWSEGVGFRQVEIRRSAAGAPEVELHAVAAQRAQQLGVRQIHLSISHDGGVAAAVAVFEGDTGGAS